MAQAVAIVVASALLSGCGLVPIIRLPIGRPSPTGPTAAQLATSVVANYDAAPVVQVKGSYDASGTPVTVDLTLQPGAHGSATGTATYKMLPLTYLSVGGQTFMEGPQYWQQAPSSGTIHLWPQYGQGWVLAPTDDPAANAISATPGLGGPVLQLSQQERRVHASGSRKVQGEQVQRLVSSDVTWEVSSKKPYRLLQITYAGDTPRPGGIAHATLQVTYGGTLQATAPPAGQFVNPTDASTVPAWYTTASLSALESCDQGSCGFTVTVQNQAGPPQGQTVATLGISKDAQATQR